jgi:hypothetical protein
MAGRKRPAERELGGRAPKLLREVRPCGSAKGGEYVQERLGPHAAGVVV